MFLLLLVLLLHLLHLLSIHEAWGDEASGLSDCTGSFATLHTQPCFYQLALLSNAWLDHASGIRRITISTLQPSRCLNRFSCLPYCLQNVCFRYYHAPLFTLLPMCCSRLDYADVQACYSGTHMLSACAHTSAVSSGNACEASQGVQPPNTLQEYVSKPYYLFVLTATVDTSC